MLPKQGQVYTRLKYHLCLLGAITIERNLHTFVTSVIAIVYSVKNTGVSDTSTAIQTAKLTNTRWNMFLRMPNAVKLCFNLTYDQR